MSEELIETPFLILRADNTSLDSSIKWPREPWCDLIRQLIEPLLDGESLEHVSVLYDGMRRDLFVSELGHLELTSRPPLPRNDRATTIYRAAWLSRHPDTDPEEMPWIAGTAVLFLRRVWF
jgi:hypothetical protein